MHPVSIAELPYDPNQVTPGVIGFAATALIALVVMLLMWDFNRRVRRINDRAEVQERLQAEVDAAQGERAEALQAELLDTTEQERPRDPGA